MQEKPTLQAGPAKRCPRCRLTKPLSAFYTRRRGQPSSYCRDCQRAATRASYLRRRSDPDQRELMRARDRNRKRQARALNRAMAHAIATALDPDRGEG